MTFSTAFWELYYEGINLDQIIVGDMAATKYWNLWDMKIILE